MPAKRKDLPGFYWDEDRERYFPLSSRPTVTSKAENKKALIDSQTSLAATAEERSSTSLKARTLQPGPSSNPTVYAHTRTLRNGNLRFSEICNVRKQLWASAAANLISEGRHRCLPPMSGAKYLSFQIFDVHDRQYLVTGDNYGQISWRFRDKTDPFSTFYPSTECVSLGQEVRHVLNWGTRTIGIGTGISCNIFVTDMATNSDAACIWKLAKSPDAFSASIEDEKFVLGTQKSIKVIEGIFHQQGRWRTLMCGSDAMAVTQQNNTILAGCRNGTVQLFDVRGSRNHGTCLFEDRFRIKGRRFIDHLKIIRDWELLVRTSAGDLELFDLRFSVSSDPIVAYKGHINSFRSDLGLCVDPNCQFVFSVGEDNALRGWSLDSGRPLQKQTKESTRMFDELIIEEGMSCIQATEDKEGTMLWTTAGKNGISSFKFGSKKEELWFKSGIT